MQDKKTSKKHVLELIDQAQAQIPKDKPMHLPVDPEINAPQWAEFEWEIWECGETIRQIMLNSPSLRKDKEIADKIVLVATNRNALRGRQSFIMLLGFKVYATYDNKIIKQIDDEDVTGHIINTLYKMRSYQYSKEVQQYMHADKTWVRNEAERYTSRSTGVFKQ